LALSRLLNYATETASAQALKDQAQSQVREQMTDYGRIDELLYDGHMHTHENHLDPSSPSQGFWEPTKHQRDGARTATAPSSLTIAAWFK
jgi:hypothetical protein